MTPIPIKEGVMWAPSIHMFRLCVDLPNASPQAWYALNANGTAADTMLPMPFVASPVLDLLQDILS